MRKTVLTFGLIAGGILSAMLLLSLPFQDALGLDKGAYVGYTTMVLAFVLVYFGVRSYRDTVADGTISFGRACLVGGAIVGVATVCYVATWEVVYYWLSPDIGQKYIDLTLEEARKGGASAAELAAKSRELAEFQAMYRNPLVNMAITFLEPLPVGVVFTLITAGLLRRSDAAAPDHGGIRPSRMASSRSSR